MTAVPEDFQRAAYLARLALARAARGDTVGALALARRAVELPARAANAVVPELYVISQLAACVPILAHETFANVRAELVSHIATLASTLPPQHWHSGHESLVTAWTSTGRADDIESLYPHTLPTAGDYASYSLRGLHAAIARALAACGRLDRAAEVMEALPPDVTRDTDRLALIERVLEASRVDLGERTLARVYYGPNRVSALAAVAAGVERLGRRDEALAWLDRALAAATTFGDDTTRVALYAEAGRALLTGGQRDAATRLADRALAINTRLAADHRSSESDVSLALLLIELGNTDGFLRVAPRRGDNWGMRYLARYADALMAHDGFHTLSTLFFEAVAEEPGYLWPGDAVEHLATRARVLRMLGYTTKATELFEAALSTMQDMDRRSESVHGEGFGAVARYLREIGDVVRASTLLEQGLQRGFQVFEEESLAHAARAFADLGMQDRATTVATDALASVDFTASYTNTDGIHDALMALAPAALPEAVRALVARARAAGRTDYVRLAATYGVQALQDRQLDGPAITLLFETVPLFRGEPRGSLLWAISRWSSLLARLDADGLVRLCDWVEGVTGWWERA